MVRLTEDEAKRLGLVSSKRNKPIRRTTMELIIKIDEELYEAYKGKPPMLGDAGMDMIAQAIANGTPYNTTGDLISREALKEQFSNNCSHNCYYCELATWGKNRVYHKCALIDNAPTVEYTFEEAFQKTICEQKLYCPARSHGEWIKWNFKTFGALGDWEYKCSNCEKVYGGEYNFCPNCGADMRGNENG